MGSNYHNGKKNEECYFCNCGPPLIEHHVIPQRFGGPNSKENVVELCDLCHKKIERLYDKRFYEWFGIKDEKGERKFHRECENKTCRNRARMKVDFEKIDRRLRIRSSISRPYRGLYCQPCVAKNCKEVADVIETEFEDLDDPQKRLVLDVNLGHPILAEEIMDVVTIEKEQTAMKISNHD